MTFDKDYKKNFCQKKKEIKMFINMMWQLSAMWRSDKRCFPLIALIVDDSYSAERTSYVTFDEDF